MDDRPASRADVAEPRPSSSPGPTGDVPAHRTDVVLPCLDEAAALPGVLASVCAGHRPLVVDNGSRDGSAAVARAHGATVVTAAARGYGSAVHAGLVAATADVVAVIDADGSLDPAELAGPVARVLSGEVDLVCGRRRVVQRGAWPWHARAGTLFLAWLIRGATGVRLHDIAPVRVARREALLELGVNDRRCGYPLETLLAASAAGWRVEEVDVSYRRRARGTRSKLSGTVRGTWVVARDFFGVLWLRRDQLRRARTRPARPGAAR